MLVREVLDMANNPILNVADGFRELDAVNVRTLKKHISLIAKVTPSTTPNLKAVLNVGNFVDGDFRITDEGTGHTIFHTTGAGDLYSTDKVSEVVTLEMDGYGQILTRDKDSGNEVFNASNDGRIIWYDSTTGFGTTLFHPVGLASNLSYHMPDTSGTLALLSDVAPVDYGHVISAIGYTPVNKAGDTMLGVLSLAVDPSSPMHASTMNYVDNAIAGIRFRKDCIAASTANVNIASAPASIDSVALTIGDRVLLKNQSTASQNGPYVFNGVGNALTRSTDASDNTGAKLVSATFPIREGTVNQDAWWTITNNSITLGVTAIILTQTAGAGTYVNGSYLSLTGNVFDLNLGSLGGAITNTMLAGSIPFSKLVGTDITATGTITSGVWHGTAIADTYISTASTWNAKEPGLGNPGVNGYILSSTTAGVRSWIIPPSTDVTANYTWTGAHKFQGIGVLASTTWAGTDFSPTMTATANAQTQYGVWIHPTLNTGGFVGLTQYALGVTGDIFVSSSVYPAAIYGNSSQLRIGLSGNPNRYFSVQTGNIVGTGDILLSTQGVGAAGYAIFEANSCLGAVINAHVSGSVVLAINRAEKWRVDINGALTNKVGVASTVSVLELSGTGKGFLPPRMATASINGIAATDGLIGYDSTLHVLKVNNNTVWNNVVMSDVANSKVTAGAPFTNDGYISVNIGGTIYKLMTTA